MFADSPHFIAASSSLSGLNRLLATNYASDHEEFSGLVIPTRRRVYVRMSNGQPNLDSVVVAIDFHEISEDYQDYIYAHNVEMEALT